MTGYYIFKKQLPCNLRIFFSLKLSHLELTHLKGRVEVASFKVEIINNMKQFAFFNW